MNHPIKRENMLELAEYQHQLCMHPKLKYLYLELTDECNLNCRHCGSSCTADNGTFLPLLKIQHILEQVSSVYEAESIMICITGGESFLHPALNEIIRFSRNIGFTVGLTSLPGRALQRGLYQVGKGGWHAGNYHCLLCDKYFD